MRVRRGEILEKSRDSDRHRDVRTVITLLTMHEDGFMPHRKLADMPGLGRALGGRGLPFETPLEGGKEGREALRR